MNCAPTTSIYGLHPEIISVIFENAKKMTDEHPLFYTTGIKGNRNIAFEVTATQICSYFRQIALNTPRLWTSIHMHGASQLEYTVDTLARSGHCWLDIRIDMMPQALQMDATKLDHFIDNILLHSLRWRSLCIVYGFERNDHPVVMKLCTAPAPGLQQLSIMVNDVAGADARTQINSPVTLPHIFQDGTPKLEFIRLRGFAVHLFRPPLSAVVTLHLDQITSVPLRYSTLDDILTASPHLAHLSMYGDVLVLGGWDNQDRAISLPSLRSLRVCSISGDTFSGIMKNVHAPNLESLTMKNLQTHDLDPLWEMLDSGTKFETLKSLSFAEYNLSASTCKHVFQMFPQITTFSAQCEYTGPRRSTIIALLSEETVGDVPWPKLKTLRLGSDFYDDKEVINRLLSVRNDFGCPISTIIFRTNHDDGEDTLPLEFEAEGNVEFGFCSSQDVVWPEGSTYIDHDDILFD